MRALWSFVRCTQPSYANFESAGTIQQIHSVVSSISSTDFGLFPPTIASVLQRIQGVSREIQLMIMDFAGPSLGLSLITVMLDVLPLLNRKRSLAFHEWQVQLDCSKKMYVRCIEVRGQSYLSDISNEACNGMELLPFTAKPDLVIISLDDLGIRGVCFASKGSGLIPAKAPWYQFERLSQDSDHMAFATINVRHINNGLI
jgi:hypothetical protein